MSDITFKLTAATNVGLVRTNNEDNFIVNPDLTGESWLLPRDPNQPLNLGDRGCVFVVADGMGGMNAGEVASEIAIETVRNRFSAGNLKKAVKSGKSVVDFIVKTIVEADGNIKARVKSDPSTSGMGTTIVLSWVLKDTVYIGWCGDSRAYLYNNRLGLTRLSRDHSYVQELVDMGKLDPELAFDHPNSNIITRSLGDSSAKAIPDVMSRKLSEGDLILLCSDGLCGLVRDDEIAEIIRSCGTDDITSVKKKLIEGALDAGGHDNVTVALFHCTGVAKEPVNATLTGFERIVGKKNTEGKDDLKPMSDDDSEPGQVVAQEPLTESGSESSPDQKPENEKDSEDESNDGKKQEDEAEAGGNPEKIKKVKKRKIGYFWWFVLTMLVLAAVFTVLHQCNINSFADLISLINKIIG